MDTEEDINISKKNIDLEDFSIEELSNRIQDHRLEIKKLESLIKRKNKDKVKADSYFK